ncbi:MAG: TonB family protein [Bacteroidales bacterium]|nr:TonB family protein [Bacteroidales bacterium]
MGLIFAYILKSALMVIAYYLFYRLLLSRDTFHRFNRWALLSILVLSIVLPLVKFSNDVAVSTASEVTIGLPTVMAIIDDQESTTSWRPILLAWALLIYWVGVAVFALRAVFCYVSLAKILHRGTRSRLSAYGIEGHDDVHLIVHHNGISPFSWMNYIVVSEDDLRANGSTVIAHEMGHIRHRHTLDLLFTEVCLVLQWFNPAIWLMRRELQAIHEYQADEDVINGGIDARQYQLLLIEKATGARLQSITCSLHQSSIKKRITMMLKKKSNPWARAKMLLAVPVAMAGIAVFATRQASALTTEVSDCKVSEIFSNDQENQSIIIKVNRDGRLMMGSEVLRLNELSAKLKANSIGENATVTIESEQDAPMSVIASVKDVLRQCHVTRVQYHIRQDENSNLAMVKTEELKSKSDVAQSPKEVFTVVEEMPEFPGGESALMQFIKTNLKYPAECAAQGIDGRVTLSFILETDGSVSTVEVMRTPDERLSAEAIRVVQSMPKWTPGKQRGQVVRVKYVLPVTFRLAKPDDQKSVQEWQGATNVSGEHAVFTAVEKMPQFPGGDTELMAFIRDNVKFPKECLDKGIQGRVVVRFIIEKDGSISDTEILRTPDDRLSTEAIRVIKSMPKWTPGKQRGQVVRVSYVLPVTFRLQ